KGCEALLGHWRAIASRVEQGLEVQGPDRLKCIRMMGFNPIEVIDDQRVALVYLASFALHTAGREHAYDDFKSDMGTLAAKAFVERIRSRWPRLLDCGNRTKAKEVLTDLIARNIERLEANLEAHLQHEDERRASKQALLAWDESPQGERLARYELAA